MSESQEGWLAVELKLSQAERALAGLSDVGRREEFYDRLSLFLAAARSILSVLSFQFGWGEFVVGERAAGTNRHQTTTSTEKSARKAFDRWFKVAASPALSHPLKQDRDADTHRTGAPSARFGLPPGSGLLLESGGPAGAMLAVRRSHLGQARIGLPHEGPRPEDFFFEFERARPAIAVCQDYLSMIKSLVGAARARP